MKIKLCFYVFIASFFISCDFCHKRLGKTDYYVGWINMPELTNLSRKIDRNIFEGVIEGRVTDVYWNDQYILATRCKVRSDSVIGYYIVKMLPPVEQGVPWEKTGPLSKEEYKQKKKELNLREEDMKHINIFK